MFAFELDTNFIMDLRGIQAQSEEKVRILLEMVGTEVISALRSLTSEMRPPARIPGTAKTTKRGKKKPARKTGPRRAHPGHWADITGALANAYAHEVVRDAEGGYALVLTNGMEYAAALDALDGYFVLRGVTDRGGPVHLALMQALKIAAPGWEVRYG